MNADRLFYLLLKYKRFKDAFELLSKRCSGDISPMTPNLVDIFHQQIKTEKIEELTEDQKNNFVNLLETLFKSH